MTPQQILEHRQKFKTDIEAANALGIPRTTLRDAVIRAKREIDNAVKDKSTVKEQASTIKSQQAEIEKLQARYDALHKSKFKIPKQSPAKAKGTFLRVIIPDTHGCFIDEQAAAAMLSDIRDLKPAEIVHIGDILDAGGWLAAHHTTHYVAQADYTFEQDVNAANIFLDEVQAAAPKSEFYYLEGNHERRLETWCLTQALRNQQDAEYLLKFIGAESVLHLEKRGIKYFKQGKFYDGCRIPSTIKLGHCYFTHGTKHGKNACNAMLARFGACVVFGHVHKLLSASDRNVKDGELGAWSVGCLCRLQPLWRHADPTDWTHGYGVQVCQPNGDFLHINVPIIDGKSYLTQLVRG